MKIRNVAINRASLGALATLVVGLLVSFGVVPAAQNDAVLSQINVLIAAGFTAAAALHVVVGIFIHNKVTPAADPRAAVTQPDGTVVLEPLVPVSFVTDGTATTTTADLSDEVGAPAASISDYQGVDDPPAHAAPETPAV
jgi:hypothetical protein